MTKPNQASNLILDKQLFFPYTVHQMQWDGQLKIGLNLPAGHSHDAAMARFNDECKRGL